MSESSFGLSGTPSSWLRSSPWRCRQAAVQAQMPRRADPRAACSRARTPGKARRAGSVSACDVTSTGGSKPSSCATRRISSSLIALDGRRRRRQQIVEVLDREQRSFGRVLGAPCERRAAVGPRVLCPPTTSISSGALSSRRTSSLRHSDIGLARHRRSEVRPVRRRAAARPRRPPPVVVHRQPS